MKPKASVVPSRKVNGIFVSTWNRKAWLGSATI